MRRFKVVNKKIEYMDKFGIRKYDTIFVTLHQPPYNTENILNKTNWEIKDCKITEIKQYQGEE